MQAIDPGAWQKLVDILGGDAQSVHEVAQLFLEETRTVGQDVLDAIEAGDAEQTRRHAHRIKSSSRQMGALGLARVAQELEEAGARQDTARARALAPEFRALLEAARDGVSRQLAAS